MHAAQTAPVRATSNLRYALLRPVDRLSRGFRWYLYHYLVQGYEEGVRGARGAAAGAGRSAPGEPRWLTAGWGDLCASCIEAAAPILSGRRRLAHRHAPREYVAVWGPELTQGGPPMAQHNQSIQVDTVTTQCAPLLGHSRDLAARSNGSETAPPSSCVTTSRTRPPSDA